MGKRSGARSQVFPKPAANDAARGLLPHRSEGLESMCGDIWRQSAGFPVEVGPEGEGGPLGCHSRRQGGRGHSRGGEWRRV